MNNLPTLYKRSATGAIQEWSLSVFSNETDSATIRIVYGQVGGKKQETKTTIKSGKNIGKSNSTTPFNQAKSEGLSKWKKQIDKGYGPSVDVKAPSKKPMLAHDYHKHKKNVVFPAYCQPKLDGIRCIAHNDDGKVTLVSRMGKPITTMGHIVTQLEQVMSTCNTETWDGELYIHGAKFRDITSWVKRLQDDSLKVEYHVYDVIDSDPFPQRFDEAVAMISCFEPKNVHYVDYRVVKSESDLKGRHDKWVTEGYEGAMLRHNGCPYKEGYRSRDLLKFKEFITEEFKIIGASEGKGKFEGMCIFKCCTVEGGTFDVMPEGDERQRRTYWQLSDEFIGKKLTVRFFEWTDSTPPLPRFPIGTVVRDYE